jgi:diguanylate cyclase (GGDEF)-like protein
VRPAQAPDGHPRTHTGSGFGGPGKLHIGSRPVRLFIVSDEHSARAIERRLAPLGAQIRTQCGGRGLVAAIKADAPDLVLLDLATPDLDGLGVVQALQRDPATHPIPIVVLSAMDDVEGRVESLDEGAADCLTRPLSHAELIARIRAILRARTREELLRRRVSFLEELATSDPLTSLSNRRAFDDRLHLEMERAARGEEPLSCLILDIDWFKTVNDRFGHQVGDDVLRKIAKILLDGRDERDAQCRYGGEEFVWLLPGADRERLLARAEWLRRTLEDTEIPTAEGAFHITVSIGASTYLLRKHGRLSAEVLLEQADAALLDAKNLGKNRVVFREPLPTPIDDEAVPAVDGAQTGPGATTDAGTVSGSEPAGSGVTERPAASSRALEDGWEIWAKDVKLQKELRALLHSSIKVVTEALAARDPEIMTHCRRVASTAVAIALELGLPPHEVERIKLASLIHDIGKLAVPEAILQKPAALTPAEWEVVKRHPARSAAILQDTRSFSHLADLVLYHQESFDGSGYPDGLSGSEIPIGARIIRVADAFDALTSDRPYRPRRSVEEATAELRRMAGLALDPAVVETLLRLLTTMTPVERDLVMRREHDLLSDQPSALAVANPE